MSAIFNTTDADAAVMRHHHAQKQLNQDIVRHVTKYQPCGFIELYDLFGADQDEGGKNAMERFRTRLGYLTSSHQLMATGTAAARRWRIAPQGEPTPLPHYPQTLVPPAQYDHMRAPDYVPDAGPALRAGALNFQRLPSHGDRC